MGTKQKIIGAAVVLVLALAVGYMLYRAPVANAPVEPTATTTESVASTTSGQEATSTPETPASQRGPSIGTTPFTVYLGAATQYGTSSAELMETEVAQAVVGYEWESIYPSPLFDSIELPQWDTENSNTLYDVYTWDDEVQDYVYLGEYPAGVEVQFPREQLIGPRKFKVLGIDPSLRVCPGDRSFNWNARFTFQGELGIVRTPITQDLFFFQTCEMR